MTTIERAIEPSTETLKLLSLIHPLGRSDSAAKSFEPLLTAIDASKLLKLHPVTLLRWAREKRVPHLRLGRKVMFRASELDSWCNSGYTYTAVRAA